ncbi:hypothetical protein LX32DRAFT_637907 [Colletotrichum zoysiae]|uniref:Uncharacterized protein n=1 Tax=Colletotrichum zoysiae TaxID=1216348 RepID=A0AAD9M6G5_9PEZI|nr:hypothetical protein LX32DRAFT_637907 [Colletotrichum zoysiae]
MVWTEHTGPNSWHRACSRGQRCHRNFFDGAQNPFESTASAPRHHDSNGSLSRR